VVPFAVDPYHSRHGIRVTTATIDQPTAADFAARLAEVFDRLDVPRNKAAALQQL
jgi:hypothetical protein